MGYAAYAAASVLRLRSIIKRKHFPNESRTPALLAVLSQRLHIRRRVGLAIVDDAVGPLTFGWLRPTIVLPLELAEKPDEAWSRCWHTSCCTCGVAMR